ncbi:MAG TPA: Fic family protein [Solirubrobacterales bacterium]|nr:Fic family protein [Solirubrobacterales bacterium]
MSPRSNRKKTLAEQPEVFSTTKELSAAISRAVAAGELRKLGGRLYTKSLDEPLAAVARRNWQRIASHYFPGGVVVDRSAIEAKPAPDGSLFLDAGPEWSGKRPIRLPGLTLRARQGSGPAPGDMPYMGLFISSRPRALLDNLRHARGQRGLYRTLSPSEVEQELTRIVERRGEDALNEIRDQARTLAPELGRAREMVLLDDLVGAILGTRDVPLETKAAQARRAGLAFDRDRIELFEALQGELLRDVAPTRPEAGGTLPTIAFFEAYFSNYIEGTEFSVPEAEEIVFDREIPKMRSEDAHDVLGTFDLVNDPMRRRQTPGDAEEFLELLRSSHSQILERRPQAGPGVFKTRANRAGATSFVHPDLVVGTLIEGYRFLEPLSSGLSRAIFFMFLIAEVHPFTDGNGRIARIFMNAALSDLEDQRVLIPLSYRDDYLDGLRALSRTRDPRPLLRVIDFAQRYATGIDWTDHARAQAMLEETNAFVLPEEAEEKGRRLRMPAGAMA